MARQPIDEKCVQIYLGFWQYGFNATYTLVAAVGSDSIDMVITINQALTVNAVIAIGLCWLAFVLIPELPRDAACKAPPKAAPKTRQQVIRSAWRSTAIVLPVVIFFLFYAGSSSYLVAMIKVASMGQQAENDQSKAVGKSLLMSTLLGGIGAIIIWGAMSAWPSVLNLILLVILAGFVMGRRIFSGQGMAANAGMWSYALMTMLVIILSSVNDGLAGDAAGVKFFDRMLILVWTTLYAVVAISVFDAFWRNKEPETAAD